MENITLYSWSGKVIAEEAASGEAREDTGREDLLGTAASSDRRGEFLLLRRG
jgi:hypothetical protein